MAAPRTTDTGAEARPVELWLSDFVSPRQVRAYGQDTDNLGYFESMATLGFGYVSTGAGWERLRTPNVFKVVNLSAATAETAVWTPPGGKKVRLMGLALTAGAACDIELRDGTGGTVVLLLSLGTAPLVLDLRNGLLSAAANNVLTVTRSVSTTLKGTLYGTQE
ncbi:MAG: hypothetical protein U0531_13110 [Dehalococcoidia bacterium]